MSGTTEAGERPPVTEEGGGDAEAQARRMGWKPKEEFAGNPERWVPAEDFLKTGFENPAILANRYKALDDRFSHLQRDSDTIRRKLDDAVGTVNSLTNMMRSSETRAYERARRDLEAERMRAVEVGDTAKFQQADDELRKLDKTAPPAPTQQQTAPAPATGNAPPAEIQSFYERNPWYVAPGAERQGGNTALSREADALHIGFRNTRPDMSLAENLSLVEQRLRKLFPEQFGLGGEAPAASNSRRTESPSVTPASEGAGRQQQGNRRNFDSMPREAKEAFEKYAKILDGKGKPLTKEEYSRDYWSQFQE